MAARGDRGAARDVDSPLPQKTTSWTFDEKSDQRCGRHGRSYPLLSRAASSPSFAQTRLATTTGPARGHYPSACQRVIAPWRWPAIKAMLDLDSPRYRAFDEYPNLMNADWRDRLSVASEDADLNIRRRCRRNRLDDCACHRRRIFVADVIRKERLESIEAGAPPRRPLNGGVRALAFHPATGVRKHSTNYADFTVLLGLVCAATHISGLCDVSVWNLHLSVDICS